MSVFTAAVRIVDPAGTGAVTTGTDAPTNAPTCTLPAIALAPTAPQAGVDAVVVVRSDPIYGGIVYDPAGHVIDRFWGLGAGIYLATASLVWQKVPPGMALPATLANRIAATGGGTIGVGSGTAIAQVATPGKIAGFYPVLLEDLSIGWTPYWQ